jgi:epoxyqueuosine reductase
MGRTETLSTASGAIPEAGAWPSAARIRAEAYALGFDLAGVTTLGPMATPQVFRRWLDRGHGGEMAYLERGADSRRDSRIPFPGARSAIVVALDYGGREPPGPVARYARGRDYHYVIGGRLRALHRRIDALAGRHVAGKPYVDTGPVLERELAQRAGLGWFGRNTNLINPRLGSFFLLGALFVDLDLEPDAPFATDHCGTCRRCLDACPTQAFVDAGTLDARRCISYLTIELRGAIPAELREAMGTLIFGCDVCQDVCPWNVRFARDLSEPEFAPRGAVGEKDARALARDILSMSETEFAGQFRGSPLKRSRLTGLKRNAAVALGNAGTAEDREVLTAALADTEPLVREHAAWALERLALRTAGTAAAPSPVETTAEPTGPGSTRRS